MMQVSTFGGTDIVTIGLCVYDTEISIVDYSRKDRDTFGNITLIERGYTDLIKYVVEIETPRIAEVKAKLASLRATKGTYKVFDFDGSEIDYLCVDGYLSNLTLPTQANTVTTITFEVESDPEDVPEG